MAITRTQSAHDAQSARLAVGRFLDDAATPVAAVLVVGFVPRFVQWINLTDRITVEWYEGMAADSALKTVAAGTRTLVTSNGITVSTADLTFGQVTVAAAEVLQNKQYSWKIYY